MDVDAVKFGRAVALEHRARSMRMCSANGRLRWSKRSSVVFAYSEIGVCLDCASGGLHDQVMAGRSPAGRHAILSALESG